MRAIERIYFFCSICGCLACIFVILTTDAADSAEEKENIIINWAFGALAGPASNRELISIEKDTALKSGDQFQMMVELKSMCFVYLIYHGSNGEIQLLFPTTLKQFTTNYHIDQKYYIPQRDSWFVLDQHTGLETFYLLISKSRLSDLEEQLQKYLSANLETKPGIVNEVIDQIKKIRKQHLTLSAKAERPLSIGGSLRGSQTQISSLRGIADIAIEFSATDFYGRTFTIEHK